MSLPEKNCQMKKYQIKSITLTNSRGGVLVFVAVMLVVLLGFAAFAIDIGYISTTKNELQNVADAAALAGTGKLGQTYYGGASYNSVVYNSVSLVVKNVAEQNKAAGLEISIIPTEIVVGKWEGAFTPYDATNPVPPNAVKVTARRDATSKNSGLQGPINAFFGMIAGKDSFDVSADAVAALSGQAVFEPGEIKLPIAVSEFQFPDACQNPLIFNTGTDCTAWHMFGPDININSSELPDMILGTIVAHPEGQTWLEENAFTQPMIPLEFITPGVTAGDTEFSLTEGGNSNMFNLIKGRPISAMDALFEFFKKHDTEDPELTKLENDAIWIATIPVYQESADAVYPECKPSSQNADHLIVGAADIRVFAVHGTDDKDADGNPIGKTLDVEITCEYKQLRGGGGWGGNLGTIPNLVE